MRIKNCLSCFPQKLEYRERVNRKFLFDINLQQYNYFKLAVFCLSLSLKGRAVGSIKYMKTCLFKLIRRWYSLSQNSLKSSHIFPELDVWYETHPKRSEGWNLTKRSWSSIKKSPQLILSWPHLTSFHLFLWSWESTCNNFDLKGRSYIFNNMRNFLKQQK